jgi:hypothetical protein
MVSRDAHLAEESKRDASGRLALIVTAGDAEEAGRPGHGTVTEAAKAGEVRSA